MTTVGELIYKVRGPVSNPILTHAEELRDRRIYSVLNDSRAKLLEQKLSKKAIGEENYSYIECMELERVSAEKCGVSPCVGCFYLRTKQPIPAVIGPEHLQYIGVTSTDLTVRFSRTRHDQLSTIAHTRWTANTPKFFERGGYLYFIHCPKLLRTVSFRFLAESPVEAAQLNASCDHDPRDFVYPLSGKYISDVIQMTRYALGITGPTGKGGDGSTPKGGQPLPAAPANSAQY